MVICDKCRNKLAKARRVIVVFQTEGKVGPAALERVPVDFCDTCLGEEVKRAQWFADPNGQPEA